MDIVLTPSQHDRLVDTLLDAALTTYGRATLTCDPALTRGAVEAAWQETCRTNPVTRTVVTGGADTPGMTLGEAEPVRFGAYADEPAADIDQGGPLCRLFAAVDGEQVTRLALSYSHLALDERSAELLIREVARVAAGGPPRRLPDGADYRRWADAHLDRDAAERYWRTALRELDAATPLFDEARQLPDPRRDVRRELPAQLLGDVERTAAELGTPVPWLVLTAYCAVVARFRGGERSAVGVLLDTRPEQLADAVGVYESTLPLVAGLDRRPLPQWRDERVEAIRRLLDHSHLSRAERNELTGKGRGVDLFDSVFDLRPPSAVATGRPGPVVAYTVRVEDGVLVAAYDPAIVADDLAGRLLDCTVVALAAVVSGDRPSADICLLDEAQLRAVQRHNATEATYPSDSCLHQLVEEQVARTPDAVAVVFEGRTMTYAELNRRANRLAHQLIHRGVRPDDIVGLCAEPGFDMCVAVLGILKAGAAYAPLDPFFPPDRLDYLYRDLDCSVVLVERHLAHLLPVDQERNLVLGGTDEPGRWPDHDPDVAVTPANLSYVMYTSGSTGRPKGVLIEHGGAVNFLWWMRERFELRPDQAALQWTAYSFDAAVWELFWPLVLGARVVMAPAKLHLDLDRFVDLIADNDVATLHFVPAMLQTFLSAPQVERCTSLRHVFVSGEPVPVSLMRRFHERLNADLINLYGVTEVSIDSTYYVCPRGDDLPFVRSGTPLSNTRTYVLDESLQPVPFGARGEVFIAGDSVTRGYLRRPQLTGYRFVPDPFRGGGARMYRTGDVAQLLPDGHLRFLGRSDHQVKIRGIRIELLEVAAELNALPSVRESLVVPFGEGADRGLVAYVIAEEGETIDVAKLRAGAADRMPPYMVPNAFVVLDRFPLNSNGKVDRPALPDPAREFSRREAGREPSGPVEERIAEIWCRLLGLPAVGADEEFFGIGGNSLLATQVIAEVRRTFDVQLSLREWLEANTIAELAAAILRRGQRDALAHEVLDEVELDVA
ncbi:non-ribosomal peptide synthetase [Micromonospora sp. DT31]|uniref:non-ribosomal peptide synthetase n=1 Tax=Micromonospora sp. DT31 TaxID=3393434 RepID=UPI003CEF18E6